MNQPPQTPGEPQPPTEPPESAIGDPAPGATEPAAEPVAAPQPPAAVPAAPAGPAPPQPWTPDQRKAALAQAVAREVASGKRVESQSDYQAIVVEGHRPNHTLHLILTIITLGVWAIVWILVAIFQKERRTIVQVDEWGNILVQQP